MVDCLCMSDLCCRVVSLVGSCPGGELSQCHSGELSPDNLNTHFTCHMTCTNTFKEHFVSFSYVPLSFCPVIVHYLFGGLRYIGC